MHKNAYMSLALMTALSFVAMYILMYAMVDRLGYVYANINQVYMAALMAAPMVFIELLIMGKMYPNKPRNVALIAASIGAGLAFFGLIRLQAGVGDTQFIRSMIPHHSGAILMCREANLEDAEIRALCTRIIASQSEEIAQMEAILARR